MAANPSKVHADQHDDLQDRGEERTHFPALSQQAREEGICNQQRRFIQQLHSEGRGDTDSVFSVSIAASAAAGFGTLSENYFEEHAFHDQRRTKQQ